MCGIAGYAGFDNVPLLQVMGASLAHRGPDDAGFYTAPGVGLARRRLSVINGGDMQIWQEMVLDDSLSRPDL